MTASVADDGRATLAHRDPERTAAEFAHAEDRSAYLAMLQRLGKNMASIGGLLGQGVPAGAAALWLQLQEVPDAPRGDAAGELDTTHGWTEALAKGYANRVLDRVARHAPDLRDKIRDRRPDAGRSMRPQPQRRQRRSVWRLR